MMKKLTILLIALICTATLAQDLPRIAVYVSGDVPDNEKKALGTRMLASLINSGRYRGIERSGSFLAEIEREQEKQRSGSIDDGQISELGRQFGVKFVCIADITPAFGSYQVSARVVDVETAEVAFIGDATSPLKTIDDLTVVADKVVRAMFGEQAKPDPAKSADQKAAKPDAPAQKPEIKISAGGGAFFSGDFGGGIAWKRASGPGQVAMPYAGGGAYLFFDIPYAEALFAFSAGGGKWKSANNTPHELLDMRRASVNIGTFAKYPVTIGSSDNIRLFPLLGIDYEASVSGKLKYANGGEYPFDGKDGRPKAGDLSALWFKLGGGIDFDLNDGIYLRSELLYGLRTANGFEKDGAGESDKAGVPETRLGHGLTLRAGAGVRF